MCNCASILAVVLLIYYDNLLIDFETHRNLQILFRLHDELVIETVVIPCKRGRTTVCVSSQVGCAMNCQFCYTGRQAFIFLIWIWHSISLCSCKSQVVFPWYVNPFCRMGLKRHLITAEIVEQVVFAQRLLTSEVGSITNVVFMVGV